MKNETQMLMELEEFSSDSDWLAENMEEMQDKFSERYVAVESKDVIATKSTMEELIKILESKKKDPSVLVIEYIFPKGTVIII